MEPDQPYQGFSPSTYGAPPAFVPPVLPPAEQPQMLRPLSTGEILDRTMALYRQHFWLFAGIGAGAALISTVSSALRLVFMGSAQSSWLGATAAKNPIVARQAFGSMAVMEVYFLPLLLVFFVAYAVSKAATVKAVVEISHGRTLTAVDAYRTVGGRWLRWFGIVLRQYWALLWPIGIGTLLFMGATFGAATLFPGSAGLVGVIALLGVLFVLAGFVLGILNYLRVTLAEPAAVVEDLGVNASVRRSRALVAGRKGRIFLAVLLVYALYVVAGGLQLPFALLAQTSRGAAHVILLVGTLVVGFIATSLILPVASIALTLFYLDERVRREGYDIELLLQRSIAVTPPPES